MIVKDGSKASLKLRGIGVLVAAGFVGGLAGVSVDRLLLSDRFPPPVAMRPPPEIPGGPGGRAFPSRRGELPRSFERLGLSDDQRTQITGILESTQPRVDSIMGAMLPALRAARESVQVAIERVLTPDQRRQLQEEFDRHPPWGPRGGWARPGQHRRPGAEDQDGRGARRPRNRD
jgi:hypothetical protein